MKIRARYLCATFTFRVFQIVGSAYRRACCRTHGTSWWPTDQASYGRSLQCRSTNDLCVLHLRAVPDTVPVTTVPMHAAVLRAARLDPAMLYSVLRDRG